MNKLKYITNSPEETKMIGQRISEIIKEDKNYFSQIILLTGDLGAGKTVLVKGLAEGLDINFNITSPTFNLINEYEGEPGLIHMDFYRIDHKEELLQLGLEEYMAMENVKAIEWPQLIFDILQAEFIFIKIKNMDGDKRKIIIEAEGPKSKNILKGLKDNVSIGN